jgi:hypothetical protein
MSKAVSMGVQKECQRARESFDTSANYWYIMYHDNAYST